MIACLNDNGLRLDGCERRLRSLISRNRSLWVDRAITNHGFNRIKVILVITAYFSWGGVIVFRDGVEGARSSNFSVFLFAQDVTFAPYILT